MTSGMGRVWVESVAMSPSKDWMVATGRAAAAIAEGNGGCEKE